jgi:hypothetical protein
LWGTLPGVEARCHGSVAPPATRRSVAMEQPDVAAAVRRALSTHDLRGAHAAASAALEVAPRDAELLRLQRLVASRAQAARGGWVEKAGARNSAWKRRWFVLEGRPGGSGVLSYAVKPGAKAKGTVELGLCHSVARAEGSPVMLQIRCNTLARVPATYLGPRCSPRAKTPLTCASAGPSLFAASPTGRSCCAVAARESARAGCWPSTAARSRCTPPPALIAHARARRLRVRSVGSRGRRHGVRWAAYTEPPLDVVADGVFACVCVCAFLLQRRGARSRS